MMHDQETSSAYLIETHGTKTTWTRIGKARLESNGGRYVIELADGQTTCRLLICGDNEAANHQIDLFPVAHFVLADKLSVSLEADVAFSASLSDPALNGAGHAAR